jgi:transcriptional regulator GlxA family with amidase domain
VIVLVLPAVNLLDLGGPVQAFDTAAHRGAGYRLEFVAAEPEVSSAQGLRLAGLGPLPGIAAGIDLALSLIERDHGPALTAAVARDLVVHLRRDGSQRQGQPVPRTSRPPSSRCAPGPGPPRPAPGRATRSPACPGGEPLAARAEPGLHRGRGLHALEYQQRLRLELAAGLLAETTSTVESVAARCGFRDARHFRRLFPTRYGMPPSAGRPA